MEGAEAGQGNGGSGHPTVAAGAFCPILEAPVDCEQACPALVARVFGSLEEPERTAVDDHMRGCAFCRE